MAIYRWTIKGYSVGTKVRYKATIMALSLQDALAMLPEAWKAQTNLEYGQFEVTSAKREPIDKWTFVTDLDGTDA